MDTLDLTIRLKGLADFATEARPISRLTDAGRAAVREAIEEIRRLRAALELIAGEQKVYKGHGDYDILPALDADEAQAVARRALTPVSQ